MDTCSMWAPFCIFETSLMSLGISDPLLGFVSIDLATLYLRLPNSGRDPFWLYISLFCYFLFLYMSIFLSVNSWLDSSLTPITSSLGLQAEPNIIVLLIYVLYNFLYYNWHVSYCLMYFLFHHYFDLLYSL